MRSGAGQNGKGVNNGQAKQPQSAATAKRVENEMKNIGNEAGGRISISVSSSSSSSIMVC